MWSDYPCDLKLTRINDDGYALVMKDGRLQMAHRVAWEEQVGPIPDGLVLDHLCRVRNCRQVKHLEPVTQAENVRRSSSKDYCKRGHHKGKNVRCKECKRITSRERRKLHGRRDRGATYPDLRRKSME